MTFHHKDNRIKPFNSYSGYFMAKYGKRFRKIPVDGGFNCPNRDGTKGKGGCIYCSNEAFSPAYCRENEDISVQLTNGLRFNAGKYRDETFNIAYFQSYTNTYSSLKDLKIKYEKALSTPGISGIAISTRPDCLEEEVMDYLAMLSESYYVVVEIGIESCFNSTLEKMNRRHDFETTLHTLEELRHTKLMICGHIVLGFPGESDEMILEEATVLSRLPLQILKIHQLQILKNTAMAEWYRLNPDDFRLFSKEEYIDLIISFLERLNPVIYIERLVAEVPPRYLEVSPWQNTPVESIIQQIENTMIARNTWQGRLSES